MRIGLLISLGLFVAACCLPALEWKNSSRPNDIMFGLRALAVGWSGIFAEVFAWYANPFWFLGMILLLFRKPGLAALMGIIALAISANTFAVIGRELPGDEGNVTKTTIIGVLPGCYVWMASLATLPLAALLQKIKP